MYFSHGKIPCQPSRGRWQPIDRGHSLTKMLLHRICGTGWKELDIFHTCDKLKNLHLKKRLNKKRHLAAVEMVMASASNLAPHSRMKWTATKGWFEEI